MSTDVHRFFRELTREDLRHPNFSPNCANIVSGCTGSTEMADTSHERPSTALFFCRACANRSRGWEIDSWLQEGVGARVIRVEDLGAALEARWVGADAIEWATCPYLQPVSGQFASNIGMTRVRSLYAARLARLAPGER